MQSINLMKWNHTWLVLNLIYFELMWGNGKCHEVSFTATFFYWISSYSLNVHSVEYLVGISTKRDQPLV